MPVTLRGEPLGTVPAVGSGEQACSYRRAATVSLSDRYAEIYATRTNVALWPDCGSLAKCRYRPVSDMRATPRQRFTIVEADVVAKRNPRDPRERSLKRTEAAVEKRLSEVLAASHQLSRLSVHTPIGGP